MLKCLFPNFGDLKLQMQYCSSALDTDTCRLNHITATDQLCTLSTTATAPQNNCKPISTAAITHGKHGSRNSSSRGTSSSSRGSSSSSSSSRSSSSSSKRIRQSTSSFRKEPINCRTTAGAAAAAGATAAGATAAGATAAGQQQQGQQQQGQQQHLTITSRSISSTIITVIL